MLKRMAGKLLLKLMALCCATGAWAESAAVTDAQSAEWLCWAIPLPKEAKILRQVKLPAAAVKLTARAGAGELELHALRQLQDLFRAQAGVDGGQGGAFEILIGVCDAQGRLGDAIVPDAARLAELPNKEQACLIRPLGDNRLVLAALDGRGVFYAALTLRQLLEPKFKGEDVTLPLAVITDWPDLAERGEWGGVGKGSATLQPEDIEWMAARKMNLIEFHVNHQVDSNGNATANIDRALLRRGRMHGVKMVPIISHLNGMGHRGVYQAYPELQGTGPGALYKRQATELYAPCASNPKLIGILADWMRAYAAYEGVRDISCWLGELNLRCECPECAKLEQFALETRAFVRAWRLAVKDYPDLRIRILLTQGSYKSNDKVLAEVPPEVGVTYYDGGKTYDSSPTPMIYPLLEEYAAKGGWLGVYPQLTPSWRIVSPWSCPQFIKYRMTEFVDKKLVSLAGYVVGGNRLFDFNVTAAAEWSWNAHGRSEREFALAWATRQGLPAAQAELAADWAVKLGQPAWDLYGARLVERYLFAPANFAGMVSSGLPPAYGLGAFAYIPDNQHFQRNFQMCREALTLAERVGGAGMVAESQAVLTYYQMLNEVIGIGGFLSAHKNVGDAERGVLQQHMNRLALAGLLNVEALEDWERAVAAGAGGGRLREGVQATQDSIGAAARALARFGVRDVVSAFTRGEIGAWTLEDFREKAEIVKTMDVSRQVCGPGRYLAAFQYGGGYNGLQVSRVALASAPADDPARQVELAVDEHAGSTGASNDRNIYALALTNYDAARRYMLVARIRGVRPQDQKTGQTGCEGKVWLERERPLDWQSQIMACQPVVTGAAARLGFSGKGLKVGVLAGGYGADGLLELLRKTAGIDSAPVSLGDFQSENCRVLILPQMRSAVPAAFARQLEEFVRQGGGLVATHDAVGYREMPKLCESVCAGGVEHTRAGTWKIAATHPVTRGLAAGKALSRGFIDQVELRVGTNGAAVAAGEITGNPVVVAGAFGKGRYVACGLLLGMEHDQFGSGDRETGPTADEAALLLNAIRWCAGAE